MIRLLEYLPAGILSYAGLSSGELNQTVLLQQLGNPNVSQRDRDVIMAIVSRSNQSEGIPANNAPAGQPRIPSPNIMNNQHQNAPIPTIQQPPNGAPLTPDIIRHLYLQAVSGQKQQLNLTNLISPSPNGKIKRIHFINVYVSF